MKSSLRFNTYSLIFLGIFYSSILSPSAPAQALTKSAVQAPSDWHAVQSLPAQTRIRIVNNKKKTTCFIDSVTDDHLTCSPQNGSLREFTKEEISEVSILHRSRSHSTALTGDIANVKPGDRVHISGRKQKDPSGKHTFLVDKLSKDYGPCKVTP